ncbi:hypothetical protein LEP1GSC127_0188 [Leptospira kirschneri str. 200801925]|nr:hypothetical protein LEP1GSC127_0188 [Leptospira kirschneri str. 200801925]
MGWIPPIINLVCFFAPIAFLQNSSFSEKEKILLYISIIGFIYLINYISFIFFLTKKFFRKKKYVQK